MDILEEEVIYEEKMDAITILLEELILDAMLSVLRKIKEREREFNRLSQKHKPDVEPF